MENTSAECLAYCLETVWPCLYEYSIRNIKRADVRFAHIKQREARRTKRKKKGEEETKRQIPEMNGAIKRVSAWDARFQKHVEKYRTRSVSTNFPQRYSLVCQILLTSAWRTWNVVVIDWHTISARLVQHTHMPCYHSQCTHTHTHTRYAI